MPSAPFKRLLVTGKTIANGRSLVALPVGPALMADLDRLCMGPLNLVVEIGVRLLVDESEKNPSFARSLPPLSAPCPPALTKIRRSLLQLASKKLGVPEDVVGVMGLQVLVAQLEALQEGVCMVVRAESLHPSDLDFHFAAKQAENDANA